MFRRRRKIHYYNGPARTDKLTGKVWFPFVAVAALALVLGLVLGAILGSVAKNSKYSRFLHHDLAEFGGVENPDEKYAGLPEIQAQTVDPAGMDEAEFRSAVGQTDGNAVGILLFDGTPHYDGGAQVGYIGTGNLGIGTLIQVANSRNRYSVGYFTAKSFTESDPAKRAYEKGRELALLADIAVSGIREIVIFGLPTNEAFVNEVSLYLAEIRSYSTMVTVGVAVSATESDAGIARLVAATQESADSFILDLRMRESDVTSAIEQNAYFLSQYNMRPLIAETVDAVKAYGIHSYLVWKE